MFSVIENTRIKDKCQIFTPEEQIYKMLNLAKYDNNLFGKKFLENSCGDGAILVQAIIRYIEDCEERGFPKEKIKKGLENDFVAYEIDCTRVEECKNKLDEVAKKYNIVDVSWNILNKDYLTTQSDICFDYIIGNPPYIAYPDLPTDVQRYIRYNFKSCEKGKFDYSYAFIEKSYSELKKGGTLVYIIPSNIFKNVFASNLRKIIKEDICSIDDYPNENIFENVLVSPAIISIIKGAKTTELCYRALGTEKILNKICLKDKWVFDSCFKNDGTKVGEFFKVSSSIATLLNEAFIIKNGIIKNGYYEFDNNKVEVSIIKKAASPKNKKYRNFDEYIIFPYFYDNQGKLQHYTEEQMYNKFPYAMKYLEKYKERLQRRDADNNAKWFEYGRSQALQNINQKLILISSVISDCTEAYLLDDNEVPYSGLYIFPISNMTLVSLLKILNSLDFKNYTKKVGICVSGTSRRISPKDIENYVFKE